MGGGVGWGGGWGGVGWVGANKQLCAINTLYGLNVNQIRRKHFPKSLSPTPLFALTFLCSVTTPAVHVRNLFSGVGDYVCCYNNNN